MTLGKLTVLAQDRKYNELWSYRESLIKNQ